MHVADASGIKTRLNGAEKILTVGGGFKCAITLKVAVAATVLRAIGVNVGADIVGLPDLDDGVFDRIPGAVENPPAEPGNGADAGRDGVVDNEKIVILEFLHFRAKLF